MRSQFSPTILEKFVVPLLENSSGNFKARRINTRSVTTHTPEFSRLLSPMLKNIFPRRFVFAAEMKGSSPDFCPNISTFLTKSIGICEGMLLYSRFSLLIYRDSYVPRLCISIMNCPLRGRWWRLPPALFLRAPHAQDALWRQSYRNFRGSGTSRPARTPGRFRPPARY